VKRNTVITLANEGGRLRWKIENEGFGSPPVECCWPRIGENGVENPGFSPNKAILVPETCSKIVI
jgi:hypothetical protein